MHSLDCTNSTCPNRETKLGHTRNLPFFFLIIKRFPHDEAQTGRAQLLLRAIEAALLICRPRTTHLVRRVDEPSDRRRLPPSIRLHVMRAQRRRHLKPLACRHRQKHQLLSITIHQARDICFTPCVKRSTHFASYIVLHSLHSLHSYSRVKRFTRRRIYSDVTGSRCGLVGVPSLSRSLLQRQRWACQRQCSEGELRGRRRELERATKRSEGVNGTRGS